MAAERATWWHPARDDLLVLGAGLIPLAVFLVRERAIAGGPGFPLDDSWIHLHFARNIAEGAGFAYNPGTPVAGSTAPLWTLLLAAAVAAFGPSLALVKALGAALGAGAALLTRRAGLALGLGHLAALGAALALVGAGPMAWGALSGMEVSLGALLVAAALWALARDSDAWAAIWAALAVLARPEALLLVPLLLLARPLTLRRAVVFGAITAGVLAPMVAFTLATVGAPVPATAAAKVEGGLLGWLAGLREPAARTWLGRPWQFLAEWAAWLGVTNWLLPLAVGVGLVVVFRRHGRLLGVAGLTLLAHPLGMALLAPYRGPGFQEGRYSIHLLPLAALLAAAALETLGPRWRRPALVAYLALAVVALYPAAGRYAWGVQNINAMHVHLGHWVDANLPRSARVAVNDIGAIAYFSRREVIDLMGLVTPEIIPFRREGEAGVLRYVAATCPDYLIVFPAWFPSIAGRGDLLEPIYRVHLARNEVAGAPEMVVYRLLRCAV